MSVNTYTRRRWFLPLFFMASFITHQVPAQIWTLEQCLDTALTHNRNIMISRNNTQISDQRYKEAQGALMPKVNVNTEYRYYTNLPYQLMPKSAFGGAEGVFNEVQFGVPHNINAGLQISMPLYNPQINGAIRTTEIATDITELQGKKTEEQVYFDVSNTYYNAQILNHQLGFLARNLENSNRLLKNMQLLKDQQLATGTDVNKVALQAEQLATQKQLIENKYDLVLNSLKFLMGLPLETNLEIEPEIMFHYDGNYTDQTVLDIRLATLQSQRIESERKTLRNSRIPTVSLFGSFGTTGFGYDKAPNDFLHFYPIGFAGFQLTYPLFNGLSTRRKINQKELELSNSKLQLDLLTAQNRMQIENARKQRVITQRTVETTSAQITLAQSIYDQTLIQQKQGTASLTDTLLADNALREAQQNYLTAIIDYLKADLELKKLTGNILNK